MSVATKERKRLKPDGSLFHQLSLPEFNLLPRYTTVDVQRAMKELWHAYAKTQTDWPPGLMENGDPPKGTSSFAYLFGKLTDAWSGQHSNSLQRSHDSKNVIKQWEPVYLEKQSKLMAIEDQLVELLKPVADELRKSDDWTKSNLGFELGLWISERSYN